MRGRLFGVQFSCYFEPNCHWNHKRKAIFWFFFIPFVTKPSLSFWSFSVLFTTTTRTTNNKRQKIHNLHSPGTFEDPHHRSHAEMLFFSTNEMPEMEPTNVRFPMQNCNQKGQEIWKQKNRLPNFSRVFGEFFQQQKPLLLDVWWQFEVCCVIFSDPEPPRCWKNWHPTWHLRHSFFLGGKFTRFQKKHPRKSYWNSNDLTNNPYKFCYNPTYDDTDWPLHVAEIL